MPRRFASLVLALGLGLATVGLPATHAFAVSRDASALVKKNPDKICKTYHFHGITVTLCWDKKNPSGDAPEAPVAVALPLSGLAVFGGYILLLRRRGDAAARPDGLAV